MIRHHCKQGGTARRRPCLAMMFFAANHSDSATKGSWELMMSSTSWANARVVTFALNHYDSPTKRRARVDPSILSDLSLRNWWDRNAVEWWAVLAERSEGSYLRTETQWFTDRRESENWWWAVLAERSEGSYLRTETQWFTDRRESENWSFNS